MLPKQLEQYLPYLEEFVDLDRESCLVRWHKPTPSEVRDRFVADLGKPHLRQPLNVRHRPEGRQCYQCVCHKGLTFPWCNSPERANNGKSREIEAEDQAQACLHFKARGEPAPWIGLCAHEQLTAA